MQFIDTNIFIRHLTNDDPKKAPACFALFKKAQDNAIQLTTSEAVIAEIVYVLSSKVLYNLPRNTISMLLSALLNLKGLRIPKKNIYLQALNFYVSDKNLDFEDCLTICHMYEKKITKLITYDSDFKNIPNITPVEP